MAPELRAPKSERPYVESGKDRKPVRPKPPAKGPRRRPILLRLLILLVVLGGAGAVGLVFWYARDLPDIDALGGGTRRPAITLLAADGTVLAALGDVYGEPMDLEDLPSVLPAAVLATEDRRFYRHHGVDPIGLLRALARNILAGSVQQGGSTITQQLAKVLFLKPERTLKRKVQEAILAFSLERRFSKRELLTIYLNRVYLGAGTFGVDAAARRYFDKSARDLNLYESALLAGLLKAPSRFNPVADPERARARTAQVLANMVEAGVLPQADADTAKRLGGQVVARVRPNIGRYFVDWALAQAALLAETKGKDLTLATTLDPLLQAKAEARLKALLESQGPAANASQAALVVLAPDGAVKALAGGVDYDDSQFNRATEALRQPGSAFKTFVYLAALDAGLSQSDTVLDAPVRLGDWSPDNYTGKYLGEIPLLTAFAQSVNTAAVRLADRVGLKTVIATARRLGIQSELRRDATLALGSSEVTPLELAGALLPLANGGLRAEPYGLIEVVETGGPVLWRRQEPLPARVVAPESLLGMQALMQAVIAEGTGKAAKLDRPAAGKTGTSQNYRDAWFAGFTAERLAVVWMGNDDTSPMKRVVGGGLPARLWRDVMEIAHQGRPARPLAGPWHEPSPDQPQPSALGAPSPPPAPATPPSKEEDDEGIWQGILKKFGLGRGM